MYVFNPILRASLTFFLSACPGYSTCQCLARFTWRDDSGRSLGTLNSCILQSSRAGPWCFVDAATCKTGPPCTLQGVGAKLNDSNESRYKKIPTIGRWESWAIMLNFYSSLPARCIHSWPYLYVHNAILQLSLYVRVDRLTKIQQTAYFFTRS